MFNCWNADAYMLAALTTCLVVFTGFRWGWVRATKKYEWWINRERVVRPNLKEVRR